MINWKADRNYISFLLRRFCIGAVCCVLALSQTSCKSSEWKVNDVPIYVSAADFHYPNSCQIKARGVHIQAVHNKLYVLTNRAECVFDHNGVSELEKVLTGYNTQRGDRLLWFGNGYMYFCSPTDSVYSDKGEEERDNLLCYEVNSGVIKTLAESVRRYYLDVTFDEHGNFYFLNGNVSSSGEKQYNVYDGSVLISNTGSPPDTGYTLAEKLQYYNTNSQFLSENNIEKVLDAFQALEIEHGMDLYPFENGLLVHSGTANTPLCLVQSDGSVTPLIEYTSYQTFSSFNHYGDYAFLSLKRYERWDSWNYYLLPYENDSISGTYRIDLSDFTIEKISDKYYEGIFIFDNTSIFVSDTHNCLYQLDIDGNVIATLIESSEYHD